MHSDLILIYKWNYLLVLHGILFIFILFGHVALLLTGPLSLRLVRGIGAKKYVRYSGC